MSRRKKTIKKRIFIDLKYQNFIVEKLINLIMISGKKTISKKIVYETLSMIRKTYKHNPIDILEKAVYNLSPELEIKSKKVGGTYYKIPVRISFNKGIFVALSWIKNSSRSRKEKNFSISLFKEIIDTYNGNSISIKKKMDLYRLADLNRAFAHFSF